MATDSESLRVTIKEMEREIRGDERRGRERGRERREGGKRQRGSVRPVTTSCHRNAFPPKHVAEKEELGDGIEYISSADGCLPTVKQAPYLQP